MKSSVLVLLFAICLVGCQPSIDSNAPANPAPKPTNSPEATGATSGVAPMAGGAGGMTPMSGTDSVGGGGGGGVGQAAKQMAKDKSANMGSGSLGQGEKDDSGQ